MNEVSSLAWLFWDPPREAFTIPYFNLIVVWYGIIFASGFVTSYFLILPILRKTFADTDSIYSRDITNWTLLANQMKRHLAESGCSYSLSQKALIDLNELKPNQEPLKELKQSLLDSLNKALYNKNVNRKSLEKSFPLAIEESRTLAALFTDRITWYVVLGTILGARLGHVLFYDWSYYSANPIEILMIRKGGLASHGGTVGILLSLFLFLRWNEKQFPEMTFIKLLDILVIPAAMTACFIRVANFFNQEILGNLTAQPWGIIFGHPADGTVPAPRHPVQLYEALAYLATFLILYLIWKTRSSSLKPGILSGLFFIFIFGSRFFIEYLKEPQGQMDSIEFHMGQFLSLPFILFGIALLISHLITCKQKSTDCRIIFPK